MALSVLSACCYRNRGLSSVSQEAVSERKSLESHVEHLHKGPTGAVKSVLEGKF